MVTTIIDQKTYAVESAIHPTTQPKPDQSHVTFSWLFGLHILTA